MNVTPPQDSFLVFCNLIEQISQISSRLEIQDILTDYFKSIIEYKKDQLIYAIYLCTATFYPEYKNKQLNIGDKIIYDVLSECTSMKISVIKSEYKKTGDFGMIGMKYKAAQLFISKRNLSIKDVILGIREISEITGPKSKTLKVRKILQMIAICSPIEIKYLIRLLEEKLKVRMAFKTVLIALGKIYDDKSGELIKEAYHRRPDIEQLVETILEKGIDHLNEDFKMIPGIPLKPMLAQPTKNISNAYKRVENKKFTCECKYDGERIQIHKLNNNLTMYSRNLENTTSKYGDIKISSKKDRDFIIDGEVVAYDTINKKILPFQTLSTRSRKDFEKSQDVSVCVYVFDILYFNGESLIDKNLIDRRKVLYEEFEEIENKFYFSKHADCDTIEEIEEFFRQAVIENYEGIMIKFLEDESKYKPSQRTNSWIKLKKDYIDNGSDSFDLVVIGAYYGKGRRTGFYGGFLLACYNDEEDVFESVCKIGTGFDDSTLSKLHEELSYHVIDQPRNIKYKEQTKPDVWINPKFVWEVKAAAVSVSPVYCCGLMDDSRGYSLRFPRFIRERADKSVVDATNTSQIILNYKESIEEIEEDDFL